MATAIDALVEQRDGRRDGFAKDVGISRGRVVRLLDGDARWYLEDVERACDVLGLDVLDFLEELGVPASNVVPLSPRKAVSPPPQTPVRKVAKRQSKRRPGQPEVESGEA